MDHGEKAQALFLGVQLRPSEYSQHFCDVTGFTNREAMALASSFGGGVGRMRRFAAPCPGHFWPWAGCMAMRSRGR